MYINITNKRSLKELHHKHLKIISSIIFYFADRVGLDSNPDSDSDWLDSDSDSRKRGRIRIRIQGRRGGFGFGFGFEMPGFAHHWFGLNIASDIGRRLPRNLMKNRLRRIILISQSDCCFHIQYPIRCLTFKQ